MRKRKFVCEKDYSAGGAACVATAPTPPKFTELLSAFLVGQRREPSVGYIEPHGF